MIVYRSSGFKKAYNNLPENIQEKFDEQFRIFISNPKRSSLKANKMAGTRDIFEARISRNYRWTFQFVKGGVKLRHIGTHDILRHA